MDKVKQTMSHIIGNNALKSRLCNDILSDSLSHAYILEGKVGSGRRTIALMCAAAYACDNKSTPNEPLPCMKCASCKKILDLKSPDVIFIGSNGKSTVGIDTTRFLKEDVHIVPNDLEHKFYILEDADKMTPHAQNALLLTLEEPPSFVHFFLISDNASSLLETIRSRAPTLRTEPISDIQIDEFISIHDRRAAQMKLSSPYEYNELIKAADSSIGRALSLLDPKVWNAERESRNFVKSFISAALDNESQKTLLPFCATMANAKRNFLSEHLQMILSAIRDLILIKKSESASLFFYSNVDEAIELCDKVSLSFLFSFEESVATAILENARNANIKLLITKMAISASLI